jgi:hypothetical protein
MERAGKANNLPAWAKLVLKEPPGSSGAQSLPLPKSESEVWLERLVLKRLLEVPSSPKSGIIRFPAVFEKLCRNFSIAKKDCWELLLILRNSGLIEVVPNQGVRILHSSALRAVIQ